MVLTLIKKEIKNIQKTTRSDCVEKFPLGEMVQGPKKLNEFVTIDNYCQWWQDWILHITFVWIASPLLKKLTW